MLETPGRAYAERLYVDFWRRDVKLRCYRFCRSLFILNLFASSPNTLLMSVHPLWKYTARRSSLRLHISTVSRSVKRRSVSITSLTNVSALLSVRVDLPTLSLSFVEALLSVNRLCHLWTKTLETLGRQEHEPSNFLIYTGNFPTSTKI